MSVRTSQKGLRCLMNLGIVPPEKTRAKGAASPIAAASTTARQSTPRSAALATSARTILTESRTDVGKDSR